MGWGKTLIGPPTKSPPHKSLKFQTVVTRFPTCAPIKFLKKRHKFLDWARRLTLSKNCNHLKCGEFQQFYFQNSWLGVFEKLKSWIQNQHTSFFPVRGMSGATTKKMQPSKPTRIMVTHGFNRGHQRENLLMDRLVISQPL